jgi:hypothetical protein
MSLENFQAQNTCKVVTLRKTFHDKRLSFFSKQKVTSHMCELNFVLSSITMHIMWCLLWHILHYNGNLTLGNGTYVFLYFNAMPTFIPYCFFKTHLHIHNHANWFQHTPKKSNNLMETLSFLTIIINSQSMNSFIKHLVHLQR